MGICDEFISPEQLEEIKVDYGPGLSREDRYRIIQCRLKKSHMNFRKIPDFRVRHQNLNWVIY